MGRNSGGVRSNRQRGGGGVGQFNDAVEHYVSGDGMWINEYLRGTNPLLGGLSAQEKAYLKDLDTATGKALGKEQVLYRSVDASAIFQGITQSEYESLVDVMVYGDNQKLNVNKANNALSRQRKGVIVEKGFMSTTKDAEIAHEWGGFSGSDKPIVLKIHSPKHTKGIDISNHDMEQAEVLLARGTKYKVNKLSSKHGSIVVDVSII